MGVVLKSSFCPSCKDNIRWFNNIPIISFILLQGKCRSCKQAIDKQYLIVELITSLSFVTIYYFFGLTITSLLLLILFVFFIIIFFIDLKHFIIPDSLTFPLMIIGFLKSFDPNLNQTIFPNYINSLIGGVTGYLAIWSIIYLYKVIRKKEGMGLGDAKLMAGIGLLFGWQSIPFTLFFASLLALLIALPSLMEKEKSLKSKIPFAPYLIIAGLFYFFYGNIIYKITLGV